jgi:hypothetical protein
MLIIILKIQTKRWTYGMKYSSIKLDKGEQSTSNPPKKSAVQFSGQRQKEPRTF